MPAKSFSDVAKATRDLEIMSHLEQRKGLLMAINDENSMVFRPLK